MKKYSGILISLLLAWPSLAMADGNTAVAVYDKSSKMIALNNLFPEGPSCGVMRSFVGVVTKVDSEYPEATILLKTRTGIVTINLDYDRLVMVNISNLFHSLLLKGKRVRINTYLCGSGAFLWAHNIKAERSAYHYRKRIASSRRRR